MRKFILFLLSIFSCSLPVANASASAPEYLRVINEVTPFYADGEGVELLFYLPYTYYVKTIELGEILSHVECYGEDGSILIDGYAPTEMLFDDGLPVTNPYPSITVTTAYSSVLYSDSELSSPLQYVFAGRELCFYGKLSYKNSQTIYFVGYNGKLGYITESAIEPFIMPLHPNALTFLDTENSPEEIVNNGAESKNSLTGIRVIIIVCLISAGVIALLLCLKKKPKTEPAVSYYDENDYE